MMSTSKIDLQERFRKFRYRQRNLLLPIEQEAQKNDWDVFCFGGAPRGGISGESYKPRDFDLVFSDQSFLDFSKKFEHHITKRNRFGGLKLYFEGTEFDAWPLSSTWAFNKGKVPDASFENLPKTTFFNIDGLVAELISRGHARRIYEHGYRNAIRTRILKINLLENPFPELCAVRALRLALDYDLWWSGNLAHFVYTVIRHTKKIDLLNLELDHYGKRYFSNRTYESLLRHLEYHFSRFQEEDTPVFQAELFLKRNDFTK